MGRPWQYQEFQFAFEDGVARKIGARLTLNNAGLGCSVLGNAPWLPATHRDALVHEAIVHRAVAFAAATALVILLTCTGEIYMLPSSDGAVAKKSKGAGATPTWAKVAVPDTAGRVVSVAASPEVDSAFVITESGECFVVRSAAPKQPTPEECLVSDKTIVHGAHSHPVGRHVVAAFGSSWHCDVCGTHNPEGRLRCKQGCDWDVCLSCMKAATKDAPKASPSALEVMRYTSEPIAR